MHGVMLVVPGSQILAACYISLNRARSSNCRLGWSLCMCGGNRFSYVHSIGQANQKAVLSTASMSMLLLGEI